MPSSLPLLLLSSLLASAASYTSSSRSSSLTLSSSESPSSVSPSSSSSPMRIVTRSRFLSASASVFAFGSASSIMTVGSESCSASDSGPGLAATSTTTATTTTDNPRYVDRDLQMTYGKDGSGNPRSRGMLVRRFTGDSTPYTFPVRPVRLVKEWPDVSLDDAFKKEDFFRADEGGDSTFYAVPRLVYHIDEPAVSSLTQYYRNNVPKGSDVLDICSSWV